MNLPISIKGVVKANRQRGRDLGFPTANIDVALNISDGVYLGYTKLRRQGEESALPSLIFVGAAVTFGETRRNAESHILDFTGELYGREIELKLLEKIRESKKFESPGEMVAQIIEDEKIARAHFGI
ncbi:MAG: riboflavin kinase [bacterium]|nr:riboflavin kinase [bacterium]